MKNLSEAAAIAEVKSRIESLHPGSERRWGTMALAQALAHCSTSLESALGDRLPPRAPFPGRILGRLVKPLALRDDQPMRRNSPTVRDFVISDQRGLETERPRLLRLIDRFVASWPSGCTTHPHSFFGPLTPAEWATLMYKHLDHHLRQFGA